MLFAADLSCLCLEYPGWIVRTAKSLKALWNYQGVNSIEKRIEKTGKGVGGPLMEVEMKRNFETRSE